MTIFNSLGSNYNWGYALKNLLALPSMRAKNQLAELIGKQYGGSVTLTYKGRDALELAFKNSDLPAGGAIGISGFTCFVIYQAALNAGYTPVFIDAAPGYLQFGMPELERAHHNNKHIKAIVIQNTLGYPADRPALERYCREHKILIIEDLAHSVGAVYSDGRATGSVGDFVMLSFSQDKPIDAVAGGALIDRRANAKAQSHNLPLVSVWQRTKNRFYPLWTGLIRGTYQIGVGRILHSMLRTVRFMSTPMNDKIVGLHGMSSTTAGLILRRQQNFDNVLAHRRQIAKIYEDNLPAQLLLQNSGGQPAYLRFPILVDSREALVQYLRQFQIHIGSTWYDTPIGPKRYFGRTNYVLGTCPQSENLASHIVNLPTHVHITPQIAADICAKIKQWQHQKHSADISMQIVEDKDLWEEFIASHPEANFLQSWYWGEFHQRLGHTVIRHGFYRGGQLIGVSQAVVEPARRGRHIVVAGGPILDWHDSKLVESWLAVVRRAAKTHQCLFVRLRPQLQDAPEGRQYFKKLGLRPSPMHVTADVTSQLDLSKDDETIKRGMRKGARYELNRAQKLGIKVEAATDDKFLDEFCDLQMATAQRQKFVPFSKKFLSEQFRTFAQANKVLMYRATYEGKLLAMAFIIFYGPEAAYHYGASTDLARQYPGAYAIQWAAIAEARRRGCQRYNFWGVTGHGQTKHRFYGVSVFKRGFGGDDVAYLPAHDLVVSPARYLVTYAFETSRRKLRRL